MKYYIMTQTGGFQESPELHYGNLEIIEAESEERAMEIYQERHNNTSFNPAICLGKEGDKFSIEEFVKYIF